MGGNVEEGGISAAFGPRSARDAGVRGGGTGAPAAGLGPPCDRRAADFVMSREPQPGHVTMLSGSVRGSMGVLQRGQFMSLGPETDGMPSREASIT